MWGGAISQPAVTMFARVVVSSICNIFMTIGQGVFFRQVPESGMFPQESEVGLTLLRMQVIEVLADWMSFRRASGTRNKFSLAQLHRYQICELTWMLPRLQYSIK